ncbi:MAG: hypothetical protein JXR10_06950 [Cyclobacteriaceae bacterium]
MHIEHNPHLLFQWRADQLIATLLSEFDPSSENYHGHESDYLEEQYNELRSALELKYPETISMPISPRLTKVTDKIKIQAKQLSLYHPIGDEIHEYYENRYNTLASNFTDVLTDFFINKRHLDPCPTLDEIGSEIHVLDMYAGFNYSDTYEKVNELIGRLRKLTQE